VSSLSSVFPATSGTSIVDHGLSRIDALVKPGEDVMNLDNLLHWAVIFLIIALVAALLGFGGLAGTAIEGAKILFYFAIVIAIIFFIVNATRGRV
jgi:uncharacterized membrane protein YtjA (UPF0391 family)